MKNQRRPDATASDAEPTKRRRNRIWLLLAVAAVAGLAAVRYVLPAGPTGADIRQVWENHELYEGQLLRVSGTLLRFLEGHPKEHFAVESEDGYRIGVDAAGLEALDGAQVTAVGVATFDEERGLRLEGASVSAGEP